MELFIVLVLSLFEIFSLLFGSLIVFSTKNSEKVMNISVSLGFIVLLLLGVFHLIPDAYEFYMEGLTNFKSIIFIVFFTIMGFGLIIALDILGGHHHQEGKEINHIKHISLITCIFLVIHNFIEGMTLYGTVLSSSEAAVILTLGIAMHNVPLGFTLSSTFSKLYGKSKTLLYMVLIGSSYLLGAVVLRQVSLNSFLIGSLLSLTFGMILYIGLFEFLPLIKETKDKKITYISMLCGLVLMLITLFI